MNQKRQYKTYTKEFKEEAVAFVRPCNNILVNQHKTHLLWTVQTQLENNHHLMYEA